MSEKRKDKRGRILRDGETQNADGRYRYSYTENGERKQIYSWKLVTTDPLPKGRRECIALRDQEEQLRKTQEIRDQYTSTGMTVLELVKWYTENRKGVKNTTKAGYKTVCNILEKDAFRRKMVGVIILFIRSEAFFVGLIKKHLLMNGFIKIRLMNFPLVMPLIRTAQSVKH